MEGGQEFWEPMQVLEHTLQVTGDALMSDDFGAFAGKFHLPHHISTFDGSSVLKTRKDLETVFKTVRKRFASLGATALVRQCIAADFNKDGEIEATHTTRILAGSQQVSDTSSAFSILRCFGGIWRVTLSQYAIAGDSSLNRALIICTRPETH